MNITVKHCEFCDGSGREKDGRDLILCWRCDGTGHVITEMPTVYVTSTTTCHQTSKEEELRAPTTNADGYTNDQMILDIDTVRERSPFRTGTSSDDEWYQEVSDAADRLAAYIDHLTSENERLRERIVELEA